MKKRCIIHFGMHKTGSSSIQESLFRHASSLSNFHYLHAGKANSSGAIATAFSDNPIKYHANRKSGMTQDKLKDQEKKIKTQLTDQLKESTKFNFLLSAEDISTLSLTGLQRLVDWLSCQVDDIEAVGYIRSPCSFMASAFQQQVKGGLRELSLTKLMPQYRNRFEIFDQVIGRDRVKFWKFDPTAFPNYCVVRDFLSRLNIDFPESKIIRINEGLSKDAVALLYAYHKYGPGYGVGPTVIQENNRLVKLLSGLSGQKVQFASSVLRPLLVERREQISWMEDRLGASLQESLIDGPHVIYNDTDLLKFSPESVRWLVEQLDLKLPVLPSPTPEIVSKWMHALRLKLTSDIRLNSQENHQNQFNKTKQKPNSLSRKTLMKTLYLHIGTEKTGTTTLQSFLSKNRDALSKQGIIYPKSPGFFNHRDLATCCLDNSHIDDAILSKDLIDPAQKEKWQSDLVRKFHDELIDLSHFHDTAIISSEHFHSRLISPSEIQNLHQLLNSFFEKIKIIVYLRRQDELATGIYSTIIKCGGKAFKLFPEKEAKSPYYDYQLLLQNWSGIFGKKAMQPRIYKKNRLVSGSIIEDFSNQLSLDIKNLVIPENQNLTLSTDALEILKIFNQKIPQNTVQQLLPLRNRMIRFLEKYCSHTNVSRLAIRSEAMYFYRLFESSNAAVARDWFDGQPLFDDDFSVDPEKLPVVSIDQKAVDEILSSIIKNERSKALLDTDKIPELMQLAKLMDESQSFNKDNVSQPKNNRLSNSIDQKSTVVNPGSDQLPKKPDQLFSNNSTQLVSLICENPNSTKKPILHIHIGQGKTGTTAIQKALQQNFKFLKQNNIFYLGMCFENSEKRLFPWNTISGSDQFFNLPLVDAQSQLSKTLSNVFAEAEQHSFKQLIWSNEWLLTRPEYVLKALQNFTNKYQIHIIVYLRRQDRWIVSAYKQWGVKHKTYPGPVVSFPEWQDKYLDKRKLDYFNVLNEWKNALPEALLSVRIYEQCQDICDDFFSLIGVQYSSLPKLAGRFYETPNDWILSYFALFNGLYEKPVSPEKLMPLLRRSGLLENKMPPKATDFNLPDQSFLSQLLDQYQESNTRLAKEFSTPDYKVTFDNEPVIAKSMHMADPHSLIAGLLMMLQKMDTQIRELSTQVGELKKFIQLSSVSQPHLEQIVSTPITQTAAMPYVCYQSRRRRIAIGIHIKSTGNPVVNSDEKKYSSAGCDLFWIVDETQNPLDLSGRQKLAYRLNDFAIMGLPIAGSRVLWHCSDYLLYRFIQDAPGYDYYLLLDDKILFKSGFLEQLVTLLQTVEIDFAACRFSQRSNHWYWWEHARCYFDEVYGALLSLIIVSPKAINHLLQTRIQLADTLQADDCGIFCEAFVPSTLMQARLNCLDINSLLPNAWSPETFSVEKPILINEASHLMGQQWILYPVFDDIDYVPQMKAWIKRQAKNKQAVVDINKSCFGTLLPTDLVKLITG